MNTDAVTEDHRLEAVAALANSATEQLAYHRWHWTMDPTNPDRLSCHEYARRAGRSQKAVWKMATGYATWISEGLGAPGALPECIAMVEAR